MGLHTRDLSAIWRGSPHHGLWNGRWHARRLRFGRTLAELVAHPKHVAHGGGESHQSGSGNASTDQVIGFGLGFSRRGSCILEAIGDSEEQHDLARNSAVLERALLHVVTCLQHMRDRRELKPQQEMVISCGALELYQLLARGQRGIEVIDKGMDGAGAYC